MKARAITNRKKRLASHYVRHQLSLRQRQPQSLPLRQHQSLLLPRRVIQSTAFLSSKKRKKEKKREDGWWRGEGGRTEERRRVDGYGRGGVDEESWWGWVAPTDEAVLKWRNILHTSFTPPEINLVIHHRRVRIGYVHAHHTIVTMIAVRILFWTEIDLLRLLYHGL